MFRRAFLVLATLLTVAGCGGGETFREGVAPPHDGFVIPFPDRTGFIEVVKKSGSAPITGEVSFYFFSDPNFTPLDPPPETGAFTISQKQKVPLEFDGEALVTPSGPVLFPDGEVDGVLTVDVDGETKSFPIGLR